MKYAIVIPDGCADEPQESLGGKTPLQAARKPNMDRLARTGVVGRSNNVPEPPTPAGDVAPLSLLGHAPPPRPRHDVRDGPSAGHRPRGPGGDLLCRLMERSRDVLRAHPVNAARRAAGRRPATQVWLWGQGKAPSLRPFAEVHGPRGAIISAVDLVRGVGVLLGWERIDVAGATGYLDTDYAAKGRAAVAALAGHDLVCVHVEAPDEASHEGRADAKVKALEEIDRHIVGPLLNALPRFGDWRIFISPDHRPPLRTRAHAHGAGPFAIAGKAVAARGQVSYDESV